VVLWWVSLERFWPLKSTSALRPPEVGGGGSSPSAALGLKLFIEAQASISVPSTLKWSLESSRFTRGCASTAARNFAAISPSSSRSRFFEKLEWFDFVEKLRLAVALED
jgi:hypothetical protein